MTQGIPFNSSLSTHLISNCEDRRSGQTGGRNERQEVNQMEMWKQRLTNSGAPAAEGTSLSPLGAAVVPEVGPFWLITVFKRVTGNAVDLKNAVVEPAAAAAVVVSRDAVKVVASVTNNRDSSQRLVSVTDFVFCHFTMAKASLLKVL